MHEVANMAGTLVRIQECAACGASHADVALTEYNKKIGPFTHWYACPTLGDPCQLALLSLNGEDGIELSGPICAALTEAQFAGRYMVAIWFLDAEGKLRMHRICHRFPTIDMLGDGTNPGVLGMLKSDLERECGGAQQPAVMRPATAPKPLRDLLGAGKHDNAERIKIPAEAFTKQPSEPANSNGADSEPAG